MTSSSDTFPFGIADVVELLGLTVRRRLPSSLYLNCPFCGDQRGRLNVNTDKNVWRCNRCGAAGGMLALYARYNCTGNADAYREICEALGRYTPRPRVNDCIGVKPEQNVRATPQEIHQTYSLLLSMLPLTPTHKAHLLSPRRGLTEEQIARFGFKSTPPAFLCRSYAERLQRQGCTLQGVPGFYTDNAGRWTINFGSRTAGILLPAVGMDGLICGMQIRLDTPLRRRDDPPGKSGAKYIWLSSIGKPHGVTSGSPLHFVGEPFAKTVYVTEGLLKADIAHCLTGRSFVAVAGVNSLNGLESALRCMAQNGTKLVVEAYDMDKYMPVACMRDYEAKKCAACIQSGGREAYCPDGSCRYKERKRQMIQEAQDSLQKVITKAGLIGRSYHWDRDPVSGLWLGNKKGIDDYCSMRRGGMSHAGAGYPGSARTGAL